MSIMESVKMLLRTPTGLKMWPGGILRRSRLQRLISMAGEVALDSTGAIRFLNGDAVVVTKATSPLENFYTVA